MIDEKKIEETIELYKKTLKGNDVYHKQSQGIGFKAGVQWAQEEFVNSLWHDASEEPENGATVLIIGKDNESSTILIDTDYPDWENEVKIWQITKWLYLDDILPKEGGEE